MNAPVKTAPLLTPEDLTRGSSTRLRRGFARRTKIDEEPRWAVRGATRVGLLGVSLSYAGGGLDFLSGDGVARLAMRDGALRCLEFIATPGRRWDSLRRASPTAVVVWSEDYGDVAVASAERAAKIQPLAPGLVDASEGFRDGEVLLRDREGLKLFDVGTSTFVAEAPYPLAPLRALPAAHEWPPRSFSPRPRRGVRTSTGVVLGLNGASESTVIVYGRELVERRRLSVKDPLVSVLSRGDDVYLHTSSAQGTSRLSHLDGEVLYEAGVPTDSISMARGFITYTSTKAIWHDEGTPQYSFPIPRGSVPWRSPDGQHVAFADLEHTHHVAGFGPGGLTFWVEVSPRLRSFTWADDTLVGWGDGPNLHVFYGRRIQTLVGHRHDVIQCVATGPGTFASLDEGGGVVQWEMM